jgi:hypothetical protein
MWFPYWGTVPVSKSFSIMDCPFRICSAWSMTDVLVFFLFSERACNPRDNTRRCVHRDAV